MADLCEDGTFIYLTPTMGAIAYMMLLFAVGTALFFCMKHRLEMMRRARPRRSTVRAMRAAMVTASQDPNQSATATVVVEAIPIPETEPEAVTATAQQTTPEKPATVTVDMSPTLPKDSQYVMTEANLWDETIPASMAAKVGETPCFAAYVTADPSVMILKRMAKAKDPNEGCAEQRDNMDGNEGQSGYGKPRAPTPTSESPKSTNDVGSGSAHKAEN